MAKFGRASSQVPPAAAWCCAMAMLVVALATVVAVDARKGDEATSTGDNVTSVSRFAASSAAPPTRRNVTLICQLTPYPGACNTALTSAEARLAGDPFVGSMQFTMSRATSARALARRLSASARSVPPSGFRDCAELLDMTVYELRDALARSASDADGATTWLSAALTNQDTCNDSLAFVPASAGRDDLRLRVGALAKFISTALALHVGKVKGRGSGVPLSAAAPAAASPKGFPSWVSEHDRRLLESPVTDITPDAVVAQDGSGTHRSIGEAIAAVMRAAPPVGAGARGVRVVPAGHPARKVIYVKAGRYVECVNITYQQKNLTLVGDGKGKTIIDSHNSVAGGYTTVSSATVAVMGAGFIARGLSILNSAGRDKEQAVALLIAGDRSVVYQCEIKAYQDTLFAHSNRQFFADDDIAGTVDFIFGNSAAVFQGCNIQARGPVPGQQDVVTAQGRADQNENTGFSFHRCRITGAPDLGNTPVYLGRPWRKYARVGVMKSYMDGTISPEGWLAWSDPSALSTLYYGEYGNSGPGAVTDGRVTWQGVHRSMSEAEAMEFTVAKLLISGDSWLESTGVPYTSGL